jgi:hypothetical protein
MSDNVCYEPSGSAPLHSARTARYRASPSNLLEERAVTKKKFCFLNKDRPCDLTCKAAFEVDDPVDNVDCYFIWLSHHFGEGLFEVRRILETMGGPSLGEGGGSGSPSPGPRGPKGHSDN